MCRSKYRTEVSYMKTIQELYAEITADDGLKTAFVHAARNNRIVEFAKGHGCETTMYELQTFLNGQINNDEEIGPDELENVAGGTCNGSTGAETVLSVMGLGIACAIAACVSASEGHVGQETETDGRLCS